MKELMPSNKTILQRFIYPGLIFHNPEDLYLKGQYIVDRERQTISLVKGDKVVFYTYFNALSVNTWKLDCNIKSVDLAIIGKGECNVEICHAVEGFPIRVLTNCRLSLESKEQYVSVTNWSSLANGYVFLRVSAYTDCQIDEMCFCTEEQGDPKIKLGIVITHFNRQVITKRSIARIEKGLFCNNQNVNIKLVVVDNSNNLDYNVSNENTLIIPSKNYGGAGGFTRGLLYLKDNSFTHCCFMDDDASCEIESIRRTYIIYSFLLREGKSKIAISGTLIREDTPNIVHEAGAKFSRGRWLPTIPGLNLSISESLHSLETNSYKSNYGAWCYFAFDIGSIVNLAYPFFVRGDDTYFSISNNLNIKNVNGICTWIDDFGLKESPMTRYLGFRSTLIIPMLQGTLSLSRCVKLFFRWHRQCLISYNYASARAIEHAVEDIIHGSESLANDLDGTIFRSKISPLQEAEKLTIPPEEVSFTYPKKERSIICEIIRLISFNGLFIPSVLFRRTVLQQKGIVGDKRAIFMHKGVYYFNPFSRRGYVAKYDKLECVIRIVNRTRLIFKVIARYNKFSRDFYDSREKLTSEKNWRNIFNI